MKLTLKTLLLGVAVVVSAGFVSCDDDDMDATIFNTDPSQDYLDRSLYTFPLDSFCKKEFLEPYNLRFIYKWNDVGSDMTKNLTPVSYDKAVDLAVLTKYLWFDVYKNVASEEFLKEYAPRIIQVTGSRNLNASQGTETLGDASSGVKINLYNGNNLNVNNIAMMNEYFFKTMHHEFAHILDQTYLRPTTFNTISNSHYDAAGWQDTPDSVAAGRGFISPYASSAVAEDWAESMACYITMDSLSYEKWLNTAKYDWEIVDCPLNSQTHEPQYNNMVNAFKGARPRVSVTYNPETGENDTTYTYQSKQDSIYYNLRIHGENAGDVIGYLKENTNGDYKIYRRICTRDADDLPVPNANWTLHFTKDSGIDGSAVILQKIELVRNYLTEHYNISLDALRHAVQTRTYVTNPDGSFLVVDGHLQNKLVSVQADGNQLIDDLRQQVTQYDSLRTK